MARPLIVTVEYDPEADSPNNWHGWKLVTFHRNVISDGAESDWVRETVSGSDFFAADIGVVSRLRSGTAFWVEHCESTSLYTLAARPSTPRQSHEPDGVVFWDALAKELKGMSYRQQRESAADSLETYTKWANGEFVGYTAEDTAGNLIDSCWGFESVRHAMDTLASNTPGYEPWAERADTIDMTGLRQWDGDLSDWCRVCGFKETLAGDDPNVVLIISDYLQDHGWDAELAAFRDRFVPENTHTEMA